MSRPSERLTAHKREEKWKVQKAMPRIILSQFESMYYVGNSEKKAILLYLYFWHQCEATRKKGQLPAIEETRRSSAIMPNSDHRCVPQCQNNRPRKFQIVPCTNFRVLKLKAVGCQNTARRGQKCPGKLLRLSMSLLRTCNYINCNDLLHLQITNSTRVCSVHFMEADFKTTLTGKRVLEKHAVPSIFRWSRSPRKRKSPKKREPPRARMRLFDVSVPSSRYCHR